MKSKWITRAVWSLGGILGALVIGGCTAPQSTPGPTGVVGEQLPAQPKVARLVMAVPPPAREVNEPRLSGPPDSWQLRPMYEYLVGVDATTGDARRPQLASEWSLEPNGKSYRFKLRKGIQFHGDWGEFTAKDVMFTRKDFIIQDAGEHNQAAWFRNLVEDIEVPNDYEVVFRNSRPDADFLWGVSEQSGSYFEIRSKAHFDAKGVPTMTTEAYAGTGPYRFVERRAGEYLRYARAFEKHWRVTPDFPEFEFRFIKEASTRMAGLLTGEMHVASLPSDLQLQAEQRGMKTLSARASGLRTFMAAACCFYDGPVTGETSKITPGWMFPDSPLMDVRVRKALDKAIDRDALNKAFFQGKGQRMVINHFRPDRAGWNPEWEKRWSEEYGYDPAKAKALLGEGGYTATKPLSTDIQLLNLAAYGGAQDLMEAIAGYWKAVGVQVQLLQIDPAVDVRNQRQYAYSNQFRAIATSAYQLVGMTYNSTLDGTSRSSGATDPKVNALVKELYRTLDPQKADQLWRQVGDVTFETHISFPLFWLPTEAVVNPTYVSDWVFPGSISGGWTHVENMKAAR